MGWRGPRRRPALSARAERVHDSSLGRPDLRPGCFMMAPFIDVFTGGPCGICFGGVAFLVAWRGVAMRAVGLAVPLLAVATHAQIVPSASCPCAASSQLRPIEAAEHSNYPDINVSIYGIGCGTHDVATSYCDANQVDPTCANVVPTPAHCTANFGWCSDPWCYIDPQNCDLTNALSDYFPSSLRMYSYAACGHHDDYASGQRRAERLRGRVLRVGVRRNSGGWIGAYHPIGHGVRDGQWHGPHCMLMASLIACGWPPSSHADGLPHRMLMASLIACGWPPPSHADGLPHRMQVSGTARPLRCSRIWPTRAA